MTRKEQKLAIALAVSYNGYTEANANGDWLGLKVWGRRLIEVQNELGITLMKGIENHIEAIEAVERTRQMARDNLAEEIGI